MAAPWRYESIVERRRRDAEAFGQIAAQAQQQQAAPDQGGGGFFGGLRDLGSSLVDNTVGRVPDEFRGLAEMLPTPVGAVGPIRDVGRVLTGDNPLDVARDRIASVGRGLLTLGSGEATQEALGIDTSYMDRLRRQGPLGHVAAAGIDTVTSPATLATAGMGGVVGGAMRASANPLARLGANLVEPVVTGGLGRRFAAETLLGTGAVLGSEGASELLEDAPAPVRVAGSLAGGLLGGVGAVNAPRAIGRAVATEGPSVAARTGPQSAALGAADISGGESTWYAKSLRPFDDVRDEVKTVEGRQFIEPLMRFPAFKWINPSLLADSEVGQSLVAFQRQRVAADSLAESAVQAALDRHNPAGGLHVAAGPRGSVFDITDDATISNLTVPEGASRVWQDVFSRPGDYNLTPEQRSYIDDFNQVISDMEVLRADAGLDPFPRNEDGSLYVPRQVKGIRGVEIERPSSGKLQRVYEQAQEGVANGIRYDTDPRNTLALYTRNTYEEIAQKQLSDALEPLSVTASELVPAPVRERLQAAIKTRQEAERAVRGERGMVIRSRNRAARDITAARRALADAERRLSVLRGELRGRSQLATGQRQTPLSYGERMRQATAEVEEARKTLDGLLAAARDLPQVRTTTPRAGVTPAKAKALEAAQGEFQQAKRAYSRAMEAARRADVADERVFNPLRIKLREATEDVRRKAAAARKLKAGTAARDIADAETADARVRLEEAKKVYDEAKKNVDGPLFGEHKKTIGVGQWRNRFFRREDYERLVEALDPNRSEPGVVARAVETTGNLTRTASSVGDFAMPFIQGLPVLARNPAAWAKMTAQHYRAFFDPTTQAQYVGRNLDTINEMASYGVPISNDEFFAGVGEASKLGQRVAEVAPGAEGTVDAVRAVGRQTVGRFQASYQTGLTVARAEMWKSLSPTWKGDKAELAQLIRNMTGGLDSRALGVGPNQRAVESMWLAFSPRLLRSTIGLIAQAANPTTPGGLEALRSLSQLAAGAAGVYVLSGYALGKDWDEIEDGLNPLNGKKFLSHEVNGDWIGIGGQVRAISQLVGKLIADPTASFTTTDQFDNPLIAFYMSRGAPALNIVGGTAEALSGGEWDVMKYDDIDSLPDLAKHIGTSALPFAVQGVLEGQSALTTIGGLGGARTSAGTPTDRLNTIAQRQFGADFYDLEPSQQDSIKVQNSSLWQEAIDAGSKERREAEAIRAELKAEQEADDAMLQSGQITMEQWRQGYRDRSLRLRTSQELIYGDGGRDRDTPLDRYYQMADSLTVNGRVDWDAVDEWVSEQSEADQAYIERNTNIGGSTPLTRLYRQTAKERDAYYDLPVYRGYTGDEGRLIDELYERARATLNLKPNQQASEVRMLRAIRRTAEQLGVDARIVQGARRRVLGMLRRTKDRERFLASHPNVAAFIGSGYPSPMDMSLLGEALAS